MSQLRRSSDFLCRLSLFQKAYVPKAHTVGRSWRSWWSIKVSPYIVTTYMNIVISAHAPSRTSLSLHYCNSYFKATLIPLIIMTYHAPAFQDFLFWYARSAWWAPLPRITPRYLAGSSVLGTTYGLRWSGDHRMFDTYSMHNLVQICHEATHRSTLNFIHVEVGSSHDGLSNWMIESDDCLADPIITRRKLSY